MQFLNLTEFAEALYRAGNPFGKEILELIDENADLEEFKSDTADTLVNFGALAEDDYETCMTTLLRILLPEVPRNGT